MKPMLTAGSEEDCGGQPDVRLHRWRSELGCIGGLCGLGWRGCLSPALIGAGDCRSYSCCS